MFKNLIKWKKNNFPEIQLKKINKICIKTCCLKTKIFKQKMLRKSSLQMKKSKKYWSALFMFSIALFHNCEGNFNFQPFFRTNWSYGWSRFSTAVHPPPPYQPAQYSMHSTMASTYGLKQPQQAIHLLQNNTREVCVTCRNHFNFCNYYIFFKFQKFII